MPQNMLFSGNTPEKILRKEKTMTARYWKIKPPEPGEIVTASRGHKKETRFAKLKILKVTAWEPGEWDAIQYLTRVGYTPQQIAKKEGFKDFPTFFNAYADLNKHYDPFDPERTHYFIEFQLIESLEPQLNLFY